MRILFLFGLFALGVFTLIVLNNGPGVAMEKGRNLMGEQPKGYPVATLGGGCFWCTESEYRALDGVLYTRVGYMGGELDSPSYRDITSGKTGHAEVVEVTFDPDQISYEALLEFFLIKAHDPTQLNRQGVDVGTQYRSVIFPHNEAQDKTARRVLKRVDESGIYKTPIVTTIEPPGTFWEGEDYHQQYYEKYEEKTGQPHLRVLLKKAGKLK
jgi:peptide-methionine (S)-S-oxide reductase